MMRVRCLSVAYIRPKSGTKRLRKTKIGTEVAHVTHDSDTAFKVKRSKVKVTYEAGHIVAASRKLIMHMSFAVLGVSSNGCNINVYRNSFFFRRTIRYWNYLRRIT